MPLNWDGVEFAGCGCPGSSRLHQGPPVSTPALPSPHRTYCRDRNCPPPLSPWHHTTGANGKPFRTGRETGGPWQACDTTSTPRPLAERASTSLEHRAAAIGASSSAGAARSVRGSVVCVAVEWQMILCIRGTNKTTKSGEQPATHRVRGGSPPFLFLFLFREGTMQLKRYVVRSTVTGLTHIDT